MSVRTCTRARVRVRACVFVPDALLFRIQDTLDRRTGGRTEQQTDRQTDDGRTDRQTDEQTDGRMDGQTDRQTDRRTTDGRTDRQIDRATDGRRMDGQFVFLYTWFCNGVTQP